MIYIKNKQFNYTPIIPQKDKVVGLVGENNSRSRYFCLPINYRELNLEDERYSFVLNIRPPKLFKKYTMKRGIVHRLISMQYDSFYDALIKLTPDEAMLLPDYETMYLDTYELENCIFLRWDIKDWDLAIAGDLITTIDILDQNGLVAKTYQMNFKVLPSQYDNIVIYPTNIFQQVLDIINDYSSLIQFNLDDLSRLMLDVIPILEQIQLNIDLISTSKTPSRSPSNI